MTDTDSRRKEREQNAVPRAPRWLWDWKWWVSIIMIAVVWYVASKFNGTAR